MINFFRKHINFEYSIWFFLVIIIYWLWFFSSWWDSNFPITSWFHKILNEWFLYTRNEGMFWTTVMMSKLRWFFWFVLSSLWIFTPNVVFIIYSLLGYSWYYLLNNYLFKENGKINVLIALIFVVNPLVIWHLSHIYLIQWYVVYPWLVFFFLKFLSSQKSVNIYIIGFILSVLQLWQPHNFYNWIVILSISFLLFIILKEEKIKFVKKTIVLLIFTLLSFSYVLLPFFASIPNELTSSLKSFEWTEPNKIWSSAQWVINTLVFKKSTFETSDFPWLYLPFLILSWFLFCWTLLLNLRKKSQYNRIWLLVLIVIFSLTFIWNNPLFNDSWVRETIYKFIPHLRVDVWYLLLIFIYWFFIWINFTIIQNKKNAFYYKYTYTSLIFMFLISTFLFFSRNNTYKMSIDSNQFESFINWIDENDMYTDSSYKIVYPLSVWYLAPGLSRWVYPNTFLNWSYFHWNYKELWLYSTKSIIWEVAKSGLSDSKEFRNKFNISSIICDNSIKENCDDLGKLWFEKISNIGSRDYYSTKIVSWRIYLNSIYDSFFKKTNLSKYDTQLNTWLENEILYFLQSFHPERKLYPWKKINKICDDTQIYQAWETIYTPKYRLDPRSSERKLVTYIWQEWDNLEDILQAYNIDQEDVSIRNRELEQPLYPWQELQISVPITDDDLTPGEGDMMSRWETTECIQDEYIFFEWEELSYLLEQPLRDETHEMVYDYANGRNIDLEMNYPWTTQTYREVWLREWRVVAKDDGTYDIHLTMYFRPQSRFYLWLIVSWGTLLGLLMWFGIVFVRKKCNFISS